MQNNALTPHVNSPVYCCQRKTSATCEEANCEAGNPGTFVDCSGATRRRMNITSSIARPGDQQCSIVDIKDWDDLFFGSGLV